VSRENVERGRELIDAWNRRDARRLAALSHPDGEWLLPRNLLEGGSYRGAKAAQRMLADAADVWEEARVEIEDIRAVGDRVVILSRTVNVAKDGGPRVEYQSGQVLDFKDGKMIRFRPYLSHAEALEAVGLGE
jgi:ketosteroid isomerase-like protein